MEIIHVLVPAAVLLVTLAIGIFWWAVRNGQFDDLERQGMNILLDEDDPKKKKKKSQRREPDDKS
ncbi:cbb3-type cytochrome oxidase assembly protein CcoS [Aliidiomarina sp. Khilg15.8]